MSARASEGAASRLVYLYGFVDGEYKTVSGALAGVRGVSAEAPVRLVRGGALAAVVSDVRASEFAPEELTRKLNEVTSLEAIARGHEAVLDRLLDVGTVLPARLATLYGSEAELVALMAEREPALAAALRRLRGVREWGVKVFVDRPRLLAWIAAQTEPAPERPATAASASAGGAAYLAARQYERVLEQRFREHVLAATEELHGAFRAAAADARVVGGRAEQPDDDGRELVLNAAYLVALDREEELRSTVAGQARRHGERGFAVALTGPWPPYNFLEDVPA